MAQILKKKTFDAIIIGSGITGGYAAKELTEKGLDTLVLEAGKPIDPKQDYVEHVPAYEVRYRGLGNRRRLDKEQPIQKTCYGCDEWASKFFVNDQENPYTNPPDKPFLWIRGRQVGGRSITWYRQSYRWSDLDFEANARDGFGVDWPIRYADLAPWYDHVERFVGISGEALGLPQLPDSQFLPPAQGSIQVRRPADHRPGAFRSGGRASDQARGQPCGHGRARDRQGDDQRRRLGALANEAGRGRSHPGPRS